MYNFSLRYQQVLKTKLNGLNLTRITDPDEFYNKQILDSILPYEQSKLFREQVDKRKLVIDIGFGGGFPLVPLAKHVPIAKFIGFESRAKKVEAVRLIAEELGVPNVSAHHHRLEEIEFNVPAVITLKAVGTVNDFLPMLNITNKHVSVFFYKGPSYLEKEQPEFEKTLSGEWEIIENFVLSVPGTEERRLVGFIPKNVPCGTSKNLVKLSHFI